MRLTLADGLAGGIRQIAYDHRHRIGDMLEVSEAEIEDAIAALLAADQASAAVGVAALRSGRLRGGGRGPIVAILTGANIDAAVLTRLLVARFGS